MAKRAPPPCSSLCHEVFTANATNPQDIAMEFLAPCCRRRLGLPQKPEMDSEQNDDDDDDENGMSLFDNNDDDDNDIETNGRFVEGPMGCQVEEVLVEKIPFLDTDRAPHDTAEAGAESRSEHDSSTTTTTTTTTAREILRTYRVALPPDVDLLFAHRVWSGSQLMASYLLQHSHLTRHCRVVEFGAGTALPSLASLDCQCSLAVITDYPNVQVLQSLQTSVAFYYADASGSQKDGCRDAKKRVAVVGHEWGTPVTAVRQAGQELWDESSSSSSDDDHAIPNNDKHKKDKENNTDKTTTTASRFYFDVALLSECLWMHNTHEALAQSLNALLHPQHGMALLSYAHHIPGKEAQDNDFFRQCAQDYSFEEAELITCQDMPYMWDSTKTIPLYLKVLKRRQ